MSEPGSEIREREADTPTTPAGPPARRSKGTLSNAQARAALEPRPFAVKVITILLLLQTALFLGLAYWRTDWTLPPLDLLSEAAYYVALTAIGLLGMLATVGMALARPESWLQAMLAQGLFLLLGVIRYFRFRPAELEFYGLLLLSILLVLYLNYADVPHYFRRRAAAREESS